MYLARYVAPFGIVLTCLPRGLLKGEVDAPRPPILGEERGNAQPSLGAFGRAPAFAGAADGPLLTFCVTALAFDSKGGERAGERMAALAGEERTGDH